MIKAITFDLDNTLINFLRMKTKASNAAAKAMVKAGLKISIKQCQKELFNDYLKDIEGERVFQRYLKKNPSDRILAAAINAYLKVKQTYLKPYPKVKSTLKELKKKGIRLAIVTDAPRLKAFQRLDAMGIVNYFDIVVGLEDTGKTKPSTLPFKKVLKELKLKPSQVLHVGDSISRDIKGAKAVGMKTCFARYGSLSKRKSGADFEISSIQELIKIVINPSP
ncbi:MAG: HAD-IIIA family hydrolase [Nanoarchaeota archaeon]